MSTVRIKGDTSGYIDLSAGSSDGALDISSSVTGAPVRTHSDLELETGGIHVKGPSGIEGLIVDTDVANAGVSGRIVLKNNTSASSVYYSNTLGWTFHTGTILGNTSGTQRMYLSPEGYQRLPYQPGFHVSNTTTPSGSTFTDGHNTVLKFDYVNSNVGSGWNTSTYRYTAPISGRYMIYGQARFDGITTYARVYVSVNGNNGWWNPGLHVISTQHPPSGGELFSGTVQGILPLSAGDYIELKGGGNNSVGTHQGEGSFGAYLLG